MPIMAWDHFQESHYRPHLVVAQLPAELTPDQARATFHDLASRLVTVGNYAISLPGQLVQASFERAADAVKFAAPFQVAAVTCEAEWATRTVIVFSHKMTRRIARKRKRAK